MASESSAGRRGPGRPRPPTGWLNTTLRISAALVGSALAAIAGALLLAQLLPLGRDGRFAAGFFLMVPLWLAGMCFGFLARSGARAWAVFVAVTALGLAAALAGPRSGVDESTRGSMRSAPVAARIPQWWSSSDSARVACTVPGGCSAGA